jgi:signal transduction histidine kinase/ActR/RegA family two-component response regulator
MEQPDGSRKALPDEIVRLGQELEQAHVSLEDAHAEIAALAKERNYLQQRIASLEAARLTNDAACIRARNEAATAASLAAERLQDLAATEELRSALEETSVLAEELREANEALIEANTHLDQRVAERTAALNAANAKLERINADLQRRVEAETAERTKAQAALFQVQKLEAIGQLTGGIAHDFNNLLMVITSGLQSLQLPADPERRERVLRRTEEAAWRAVDLTRRLLAFARRQALHPERLDLPQQIDNLRELLTHGLREDIEVRVDIAADVWPLETDVGALELALLNLAVNARDAMPKGGVLTIAARNSPVDARSAAQLRVPVGDYVEVSVADCGTGMPPELVDKVFEPFFTTKSNGRGTGLGLAQVYGFVQQSGGTAWVESQEGKGTTVRFLLPRSWREPPRRPAEPAREGAAARPAGHLRVLVVEDDDAVATVVLDMLRQLGHSGTRVSTIAAALAILADPDQVDLVFSDVLLPGGSGLDLAREMRQRQINLPIILTSGYGGSLTHRLAAVNLPFLRKPYRIDALGRAIEAALQAQDAVA